MFSTSNRAVLTFKTTIQSVRFTLRTKQRKISVQLLKNVEGLGVRGEIVQVKPTHMMNWLQFQNRACFILPGQEPRIPVVDRSKEFKRLEEQKRKLGLKKLQERQISQVDSEKTKLGDLEQVTGLKFGN